MKTQDIINQLLKFWDVDEIIIETKKNQDLNNLVHKILNKNSKKNPWSISVNYNDYTECILRCSGIECSGCTLSKKDVDNFKHFTAEKFIKLYKNYDFEQNKTPKQIIKKESDKETSIKFDKADKLLSEKKIELKKASTTNFLK